MKLLTATWVLPVEGPPVEGGALLVSGGRIRAVGPSKDLRTRYPGAEEEARPGWALAPALVNAHAHLELTALGEPPDGLEFVGWILEVIRRKRRAGAEDYARGIDRGAKECLAGGQGTVADVLSAPEAAGAYPADGPRVAVFPEVLAAQPGLAAAAVARALAAIPSAPACRAGLSPHSPYTASEAAYRECARALGAGGLLMTHLAESARELEFFQSGGGELADRLYGTLGLLPPAVPGTHPLDWLDALGLVGSSTILVHAIHLAARHLDLLAGRRARVVLCPRSNRRLGVGAAWGRAFLAAGLRIGLGTDSRLSAGDLDLWKDAEAAVEDYGWSPQEAFAAATLGGARVLGLEGAAGSFAVGSRADILAVPLSPGNDLWDRLFSGARGVMWVSRAEASAG